MPRPRFPRARMWQKRVATGITFPPSLGIELDGNSHFEVGAREYDEKHQRFIQPFGIIMLRVLHT